MSFAKCLVLLLSLALSINALATPHIARGHHRRALSHRLASALDVPNVPLAPRRESKRCKPRPTSTSVALPQTSDVDVPESTSRRAPTTSPTQEPEHTTSTKKPENTPPPSPTTHSSTHKPTPTGGNGGSGLPSFLVGIQNGQGTFYATGLGACGITNNDGDYIAAVSHLLFDAFPGYDGVNPNKNPICNRKVQVTYQGKSVTVAITDRCEGCALTDLDFSPSAFNQIADFAVGRISGMEWKWL